MRWDETVTDDHSAVLAVTGASGFIGRGVLEALASRGVTARGISRKSAPAWVTAGMQWRAVGSYTNHATMKAALEGCDFLLHLADDPRRDSARSAFEAVEVADALISVSQEVSLRGLIIASSVYARMNIPSDTSYGAGKRAAEQRFLREIGVPVVILRLPPVYGPDGKGGISTLSRLVRRGIPLPFGLANAPRNYLSRQNLGSLVENMITAPRSSWAAASGRIFEPSDGQPISTRTLVTMMAAETGVRVRLLPVPVWVLRAIGTLLNRKELIAGAIDPLEVEHAGALDAIFNWSAVEKMPESLHYLKSEAKSL